MAILLDHVFEYLIGESASSWLAFAGKKALIKRRDLIKKHSRWACETLLGVTEFEFQLVCSNFLCSEQIEYPLEYLFLHGADPLQRYVCDRYVDNKLWPLRLSRQGGSLDRGRPWELILNFLIADPCACSMTA